MRCARQASLSVIAVFHSARAVPASTFHAACRRRQGDSSHDTVTAESALAMRANVKRNRFR